MVVLYYLFLVLLLLFSFIVIFMIVLYFLFQVSAQPNKPPEKLSDPAGIRTQIPALRGPYPNR